MLSVRFPLVLSALTVGLTALGPGLSAAITVDGQLDPSYTLMATQSTQTNGHDDTFGTIDFGNGSELDGAYAAVDGGVLYLFFAGNLMDTICGGQACTDFAMLDVFIDSQSGGQNPIVSDAPGGSGNIYAGLTFDTGFIPDYWIEYADLGGLDNVFSRNAWFEAIPDGGGGASVFLGSGTNAGAPATLSGGTNPYGIQATIDNRNTAGVGAGCAAASGAGVTTGVELAVPLAAIGNPTGCVSVTALLVNTQEGLGAFNQVLAPLPAGTCLTAFPPGTVDFSTLPGTQFFTFCIGTTPSFRRSWGTLKSIYR